MATPGEPVRSVPRRRLPSWQLKYESQQHRSVYTAIQIPFQRFPRGCAFAVLLLLCFSTVGFWYTWWTHHAVPQRRIGSDELLHSRNMAATATAAVARSNSTSACATATRLTAPGKVLVVPDVHGDAGNMRKALRLGGVLDAAEDRWVGKDTFLVQLGDVFDRGDDTTECLALLSKLRKQAVEEGGCVVQLMGNHELLNLAGDFRYASEKESERFGGEERRRKVLRATAKLGSAVRRLRPIVLVTQEKETTLFVHAGLRPRILRKLGGSAESLNEYFARALKDASEEAIFQLVQVSEAFSNKGPLWTRFFAGFDFDKICEALDETLAQVGATRMVVGHTVQTEGRPVFRCDRKLILADTGQSEFYGGSVAVLQLDERSPNPRHRVRVLEA